ncbi:hypothetical protein Pst134EB_005942 [Puccinia striiformis f. sp. tritici]|nr:hypothetical protein Pst134EB_005942 [Puccinia striiformis f. sp. tritici]
MNSEEPGSRRPAHEFNQAFHLGWMLKSSAGQAEPCGFGRQQVNRRRFDLRQWGVRPPVHLHPYGHLALQLFSCRSSPDLLSAPVPTTTKLSFTVATGGPTFIIPLSFLTKPYYWLHQSFTTSQLQSKASLQHVHQGTSYRQAPQPVTGSFDDENEQKTVVSRTHHTQPNVGWSANDPLNPLSPATRRVSRPESVDTTASQSYYSINATINSRIFPSSSSSSSSSSFSGGGFVYGTIPSTQGPPTLVFTSGESQEMVITPSTSVENEDLSNVQYPQLHRLMITSPEVLFYKDLQFNSRPSPLAETFSFGSLSRFDGFFFGSRHRLDQRYHPGSALILKVSPPISSTTFSPGESIFFKILLENPFDHIFVSFVGESRLVGEQKLRSHRFLKHEISIDSPGKNGCWEVHEGSSSKEWNHFGESEIPSSTTNKHVFIAYHLIIRGIGKQKKSDNSKRSDKDKQTNKTKVKKSKGSEERVRLTVKVKKQTSPPNNNNNDRVDENIWIAGEHNYSCVSID